MAEKKEESKPRITLSDWFAIGVIVELCAALVFLHAQIKDFIWTHPWTHSFLVLIPTIALPILALLELGHSKEANNLHREQTKHLATIADLQGERNRLQTELNEL